MRSRPDVKVHLSPPVLVPGMNVFVDVELDEETETPVDKITVMYECTAFTGVGAGKGRQELSLRLHAQAYALDPKVLSPGKHRHRLQFQIPDHVPPSYAFGWDAAVRHEIEVHVDIPWWLDRKVRFVVPVRFAPGDPPRVNPQVFATSLDGPRGTAPFLEVALATIEVAPGDVLAGTVSLANLGDRRVRGVHVSLVERESIRAPGAQVKEVRRFTIRAFDGAPPENEAIPFRLRVPDEATPTFQTKTFGVTTHLEVRADVAWGHDVVVTPPILVLPRSNAPREAGTEWVAPVGRDRRMAVWRAVAGRLGLAADEEHERLVGMRGDVAVALRTEHRDDDFWLAASLVYPDLGLDLAITPRSWTDVLAVGDVKSGDGALDGKLVAYAREQVQAKAVVPTLFAALGSFEEVSLDDHEARIALRGAAHSTDRVEGFAVSALRLADAIVAARSLVPPPAMFASDVPAWEAFATVLRGRFDRGRMWIHDGSIGTDRVEVGAAWSRSGLLLGTTLRVVVDPPIAPPPTSPEDPALSPAAREAWRELRKRVRGLVVAPDAIVAEIEGKVADPATLMPALDLALALRRALAGLAGSGPFR